MIGRPRTAWAEIDLNVRTRSGTYVGIEDITGDYDVGDVIYVVEPESGLWGSAQVTSIDEERRLVYLSLAWNTLTPRIDVDAILASLGPEFADPGDNPWGTAFREPGGDCPLPVCICPPPPPQENA